MAKKILIFSDSHGINNLMLEIIEKEKPNYVFHAGDYCCDLNQINKHFDHIVAGNNDFIGDNEIYFNIDKINFFLTHGDKYINQMNDPYENAKRILKSINKNNIQIIIYGHSHIESVDKIDNILIINPGSISFPRNKRKQKTYAIIEIENNKLISEDFNKIIKYL